MKRIIIAAVSENGVIGNGNALPWEIPEEYKHYLNTVTGQVMIMGRKSWEIFGADLKSCHNIVITRTPRLDGVETADSLEHALDLAERLDRPIFIGGGESVYAEALHKNYIDEMHLSIIKGTYEGDTWFPKFDESRWEIAEERDEPQFTFRIFRRKRF